MKSKGLYPLLQMLNWVAFPECPEVNLGHSCDLSRGSVLVLSLFCPDTEHWAAEPMAMDFTHTQPLQPEEHQGQLCI